jgi:hypothetical protein
MVQMLYMATLRQIIHACTPALNHLITPCNIRIIVLNFDPNRIYILLLPVALVTHTRTRADTYTHTHWGQKHTLTELAVGGITIPYKGNEKLWSVIDSLLAYIPCNCSSLCSYVFHKIRRSRKYTSPIMLRPHVVEPIACARNYLFLCLSHTNVQCTIPNKFVLGKLNVLKR